MAFRCRNGRHFFRRHAQFPKRQSKHFLYSSMSWLRFVDNASGCRPEHFMHSHDLSEPRRSLSTVKVHDLLNRGCLSYSKTWAYQQLLLNRRLEQRRSTEDRSARRPIYDQDCVLILEHSPVYTLGRGADERHLTFLKSFDGSRYSASAVSEKLSRKVRGPGTARLSLDRCMESQIKNIVKTNIHDNYNDGDDNSLELSMLSAIEKLTESISPVVAPNGVPIYRVERGGEVTFHGPSQLVVYPMFDLKHGVSYKQDLHWYLWMIEEVIIQTLSHYNIDGERDDINTGVWVRENKVAAVGVSSSRWITTHGFALNLDPDLSYFDTSVILPCGIEGRGVTSMGNILRERNITDIPSIVEVAAVVTDAIENVFNVKMR